MECIGAILVEQGVAAISHSSEQFGLFGIFGEIVELIGIGAKIKQLFKRRMGICVTRVSVRLGTDTDGFWEFCLRGRRGGRTESHFATEHLGWSKVS